MTKKMIQHISAVLVALILAAGTMLTAFAESTDYVPYESYTYWDDISGAGRKLVYNRPMFDAQTVLGAKDLGVAEFTELNDVCTDKEGNIYLLDNASRIVLLDSNYKLIKEITSVTDNGEALTFTGAKNIYVHTDGTIYLCDTENKRVLHFGKDGVNKDVFVLPDSPLIPEDFNYRPVKAVADSRGYVYILSEGSYYGALLYAPDKKFIGFYGANTVTNNILGAVSALFDRMFPNNEKKSNDERTLPYTFSDIVIDSEDFIYTATDSASKAQIKKLNPGAGNNILESADVNFGDDGWNNTYLDGGFFNQSLKGLEVDDDGFLYCLDVAYGRVIIYDADCRMITAFGGGMGNGTQDGTFMSASAIALKGTDIIISDRLNNTITVFERNAYADKVFACDALTLSGDYLESKEGWEEILREDKNLQIAYMGLARAYLAEDQYKEAMDIALEGYDRDTYALAYEYYRGEWIDENFTWLFLIIVAVVAVIVVLLILNSKKKRSLEDDYKPTPTEFRLVLNTLFHPGKSFEEIKDKGKGSIKISLIILALFYVTAVLQTIAGGFLFTNYDPGSFNSLWVLVQSVGLVALWVVSNWLVCTLAGGKGKIKEIIVITCYSLMPMILGRVIWIILSNFLLPAESSFLSIIMTVALIYTAGMLIIGMLRIHDFTMTKFLWTTLLTVLMMAAIIFLIILIIMLLQQLSGFLTTVVIELLM